MNVHNRADIVLDTEDIAISKKTKVPTLNGVYILKGGDKQWTQM